MKPTQQLLLILAITLLSSLSLAKPRQQSPENNTPPEKWEADIASLEARFARRTSPTARVVFVGSSTIRRWPLKTAFPNLDAVNHGFGGSFLSDAVHFFDRIVKPANPEIIVLYAGDNDLNARKSPDTVVSDFQAFLDKVDQSLPHCRKILFLSIKPSIKRWKNRENILRTNQRIQSLCNQHPRAEYVDLWQISLDSSGQPRRDLLDADNLHLSEAGYELWSSTLTPLLLPE